MDDLTLPGTIPGLLRRGSPVRVDTGDRSPHIDGRSGTVHRLGDRDVVHTVAVDGIESTLLISPAYLNLDLTDETGRFHAYRWLAGHIPDKGRWEDPVVWVRAAEGGGWLLHSDGCDFVRFGGDWLPALAHLDPEDPRLLPDGRRWVDAEALRIVCLHVAGEVERG